MTEDMGLKRLVVIMVMVVILIYSVAMFIVVAIEDQARIPEIDSGSHYIQSCMYEPQKIVIVERKLLGQHIYYRFFRLPTWCSCDKYVLLPQWLDVNKEQESCTFRQTDEP